MSEHDNDNDNDNEKKPMKIMFAEGCFDDFDGTQEELDELVAEIQKMFDGKTHKEIEAMSIPVDSLEELDEEVLDILPMLTAGNTRH